MAELMVNRCLLWGGVFLVVLVLAVVGAVFLKTNNEMSGIRNSWASLTRTISEKDFDSFRGLVVGGSQMSSPELNETFSDYSDLGLLTGRVARIRLHGNDASLYIEEHPSTGRILRVTKVDGAWVFDGIKGGWMDE